MLSVTVLDGTPGHIKAAIPPLCDIQIVEMDDAGSAVFLGLSAAQLVVVLNDQSGRFMRV
jgi:hypothetical protein